MTDYNIPEIQDSWKPKIGDRVRLKLKEIGTMDFIILHSSENRYEIQDPNEKSNLIEKCEKQDLIFIPSIEWFLEQMGIKTVMRMMILLVDCKDVGLATYELDDLELKEYLFRLFMFQQGKIWEIIGGD